MKLISWNVNGMRAVAKKGFLDFFLKEKPDVFCLQETRCYEGQLEEKLREIEGYYSFWVSAKYSSDCLNCPTC